MLGTSRATFILLLLFAPLAFGSVEPWAFFFLALLTGLSFLFYLADCLATGRPFYQVPGLIPLLLVGAYLVFQLIPLPESLLEILSPRSLAIRQKTAGIFSANTAWPISLDIRGGISELSRFLVCCGCYVLSIQLLSDGKMLKRTVLVLVFFGGLLAIFSVLQSIFTVDRVLWFRTLPPHYNPFGPYVNPNHYAGLMEMIFPLALALAYAFRPSRQFGNWREKLLGFFDDDDFLRFLLLCLAVVIMALSVVMSLSRAGMVGLCMSLLFFVAAVFRSSKPGGKSQRRIGFILLTAVLVIAIGMAVSWFGWEQLDREFRQLEGEIESTSPMSRSQVLKNGLNIIKDFPLVGSGFGSFRNVYPRYYNDAAYGVLDHAHNDYLQLLTEGGIAGALLFLVFFTSLFRATLRALVKRIEPYAVFVCLGAGAGLVAIFIHSAGDFNLHINANTLYFSFLCALMVSAAHTRFRDRLQSGTYLTPYRTGIRRLVTVTVVTVTVWVPLLVFAAGQWAAAHYAGACKQVSMSQLKDPAVRETMEKAAARASGMDPLEASYRAMAGDAAFAAGDFPRALTAYQRAVMLTPTRSEFLQKAGRAAYYADKKNIDQADALMAAGIEFYPTRADLYARYAAFLLRTDRPAAARDRIRQGISLNPGGMDMFLKIMQTAGMTPAEMYIAMPDRSYALERFATYIEGTDYGFMKKEILLKAVDAAEREGKPSASVYSALARLCVREKHDEEALAVLEKGVARLPDHTGLMLELAMLYERLQITYKAVELYKKILIIDPGNKNALARMENRK